MTKGGARPRAGRPADPNSESARKRAAARATAAAAATTKTAQVAAASTKAAAFSPTALPSEGYKGRVPAFPLPKINRTPAKATAPFRAREMAVWREAWKTPQAAAWARDPWRWSTIGEYCRLKTAVELDPDSNAALHSRLREYRAEIGLTPDGLRMNGWAIAPNEVAQQAAKKAAAAPVKKATPTRRLRSVGGKPVS